MPSKFFVVVSRMNGLVLDVSGGNTNPGASVVMAHRAPGNKSQQWYEDTRTCSVRSRINDLCLEISGHGALVLNPYNASNAQQRWEVREKKGVLENKVNPNTVLDIHGENKQPGATLCAWQFKNSSNQLWNFDFLEPEYFQIISEMHDKVLEVQGSNPAPGTRVCMNRPNGGVNQQWFESKKGIRSRLNNLPLTTAGVLWDGAPMMVKPAQGPNKPDNHFWILSGNKVVNKADPSFVCDIAACNGCDGADVIAHKYVDKPNQHWRYQQC